MEKVNLNGLRCPECGYKKLIIIQTRNTTGGRIKRRRVCQNCKKRFTTYEKILG